MIDGKNLFRAKHIHASKGNWHLDGSWVEGYLSGKNYINSPALGGEFLVDEKTICRNTGMTDKDGREIWEDDIVEVWGRGHKAIGVVKKRTDGLWIVIPAWRWQKMWGLFENNRGKTTVKVIGNIFDNPELMEGDGERRKKIKQPKKSS